jgi:hypothetical protein
VTLTLLRSRSRHKEEFLPPILLDGPLRENTAGVQPAAYGTSIASDDWLGIAGPSLRQGAAGTSYFEPGGVSFWDFRTGPLGYSLLLNADLEIVNKFVTASFRQQEALTCASSGRLALRYGDPPCSSSRLASPSQTLPSYSNDRPRGSR